jgi:segregation and condensation protein B
MPEGLEGFGAADPRFPAVKRDLEALLFAAGSPLTVETLSSALAGIDPPLPQTIEAALAALADEFPAGGERGFELAHLAGGWAFRTNPACQQAVSALFELPDDVTRLSPAAMEVLAIVAYLQPVSRPQIAEIRGVNSDSPVQKLLERELVTEVGRSQSAGGAVLYGTTERFEAMFGLAGLDELPDLEGFALGEEQKEDLRRRLGLLSVPE